MPDYTTDELFAVLLARDLHPEDRMIQVGANMPMARAAAVMANMTRLPDARVCVGLAIDNLADGRDAPPVYPFVFDSRGLRRGEAYMYQQWVFDDMSRPDVFFVGGLQVDRRGNVNLLGIPGEDGGWQLRGPGAVALPTMSTYCRGYYIVMPRHAPRTFVEEVACITALGDVRRRAEFGFPGGGPRLVLSPLGVFDFDEDGDMRVRSLHEGVTAEQAQEATGFDLRIDGDVPVTPSPTEEELLLLRERVDRGGLLRNG
ncbi:MAG: hypothetical protein IRZ07_06310 [Microbispora sp.]|nr:hypothetical protein [Microbispora sp.]